LKATASVLAYGHHAKLCKVFCHVVDLERGPQARTLAAAGARDYAGVKGLVKVEID